MKRRGMVATAVGVAVLMSVTIWISGGVASPAHRGATVPRTIPAPGMSQWSNGEWQSGGQFKLRSFAITAPRVGGVATQRLAYRDVMQPNGGIIDLRYVNSPLREFAYHFSAAGKILETTPIAPPIPLSCQPKFLLSTPLLLTCTFQMNDIYSVGKTRTWHLSLPRGIKGAVYAQASVKGIVRILFCAAQSPNSTLRVTELTIAGGRLVREVTSREIHVLDSQAGGGIDVAPAGTTGWLVVSDSLAPPPALCDLISSYDNMLNLRWSHAAARGTCFELRPSNPVQLGSKVFLALGAGSVLRMIEYDLNGKLDWATPLVAGSQLGTAAAPLLSGDSQDFCVVGFGDGSFVGESTSNNPVDYAYMARVSRSNGAILWKARMVTQLESGSKYFALYLPTTAVCSKHLIEALDPLEQGVTSPQFPISLVMTARK